MKVTAHQCRYTHMPVSDYWDDHATNNTTDRRFVLPLVHRYPVLANKARGVAGKSSVSTESVGSVTSVRSPAGPVRLQVAASACHDGLHPVPWPPCDRQTQSGQLAGRADVLCMHFS